MAVFYDHIAKRVTPTSKHPPPSPLMPMFSLILICSNPLRCKGHIESTMWHYDVALCSTRTWSIFSVKVLTALSITSILNVKCLCEYLLVDWSSVHTPRRDGGRGSNEINFMVNHMVKSDIKELYPIWLMSVFGECFGRSYCSSKLLWLCVLLRYDDIRSSVCDSIIKYGLQNFTLLIAGLQPVMDKYFMGQWFL